MLQACSSSPTAPGTTTGGPIGSGSILQYHIAGVDLVTGEEISIITADTVVANSVTAMGKSGVVQFNDSCNTMLPFCYYTSVAGNSFSSVWSKTPPYMYFHINGDVDVPFSEAVQDTTILGVPRMDSTFAWITLPFASKIGSVVSISDPNGLLLLDSIRSLADSTFQLSGKSYATNEVEVSSRESAHGELVDTRVSYAPGLHAIVRTWWLVPDGSGQRVQVASKVLQTYTLR